ncbi:DUF2293 domain-containing protein [Actomonas aquatica]|uniref:DUF2293 domain-containing protein n=1 Tax=Actomonas aquatica TaxID=2866162 RepID=A0ABZ1C3S5_9BACT|nr:DUF2293 domain-containing protein [Opitutus sp. WL0086]WRQ86027.1 DUF2293 domain-containing protein [Opitutus sp. WL0086]
MAESSPFESLEVRPLAAPRKVLDASGNVREVPDGWALLPPGDAALSRRIKADGPSWTVIEKKGRKRFSHGIWAPAERIAALRAERAAEQADPAYTRKLEAGRARRAVAEAAYVEDFRGAILAYLDFHPRYQLMAAELADRITQHATPVGSGTVARTQRIPVAQRAEAATIAWLRHQTTGYDSMSIARIKGERRAVRRELAQRSKQLLARYREGAAIDVTRCPLHAALRAGTP